MNPRSNNSPYSQFVVLSPTAPLTSGGSLQLADGQIALTQTKVGTANGKKVVSGVAGAPAKTLYQIEVGTGRNEDAGNQTNKNMATHPFTKDQVLDVTYSPAKAPVFASTTIGYNGVAGTGFSFKQKQATTLSLTLTGAMLSYLGYREGRADMQFSLFAGNPDDCADSIDGCTPISCKELTSKWVKQISEHKLRPGSLANTGAAVTVGDIVDVIPTFSCAPPVTPTATSTTYSLTIQDEGTQEALAIVKAQYPSDDIDRVSREGITSVYELSTTGSAPADFNPLASNEVLLDCDCPTNYTAAAGGWVYVIEADDAGTDASTTFLDAIIGVSDQTGAVYTFENLGAASALRSAGTYTGVASTGGAGTGATFTVVVDGTGAVTSLTVVAEGPGYAIGDTITIADAVLGGGGGAPFTFDVLTLATKASSVTKVNNDFSIGTYVLVFPTELSEAQTDAIIAENESITVDALGEAGTLCTPDSQPADTSWASVSSCTVATKTFYIDLRDEKCGDSRLAELQAEFPELTIVEDTTTDHTNCRRRYTTTVTSSVVCEDCETPEYLFEAPADIFFESWHEEAIPETGLTSWSVAVSATPANMTPNGHNVTLVNATPGVTYAGSGTGAVVAISGSTDTEADVITISDYGTGYAVGETITIDLTAALGGSETGTIVLTITGVGGEYPTDC